MRGCALTFLSALYAVGFPFSLYFRGQYFEAEQALLCYCKPCRQDDKIHGFLIKTTILCLTAVGVTFNHDGTPECVYFYVIKW